MIRGFVAMRANSSMATQLNPTDPAPARVVTSQSFERS